MIQHAVSHREGVNAIAAGGRILVAAPRQLIPMLGHSALLVNRTLAKLDVASISFFRWSQYYQIGDLTTVQRHGEMHRPNAAY